MPGALTWDPTPAGGALSTARGAPNPTADGSALNAAEVAGVRALVSGAWILNGATAGQDSGWVAYIPGMRLAYALDSGTTSTTFSVDISADGVSSLAQAFTGTWASSTLFEITQPIWLLNQAARFIRFNVLTGGPLSVRSNV